MTEFSKNYTQTEFNRPALSDREIELAHGIKVGDLVRDRYRRTFEVNSVSGTCLTGYAADGTSAKLESFHSTKVFKLYRVVRDGKEILVTVPEKEAL